MKMILKIILITIIFIYVSSYLDYMLPEGKYLILVIFIFILVIYSFKIYCKIIMAPNHTGIYAFNSIFNTTMKALLINIFMHGLSQQPPTRSSYHKKALG